MFGDQRSTPVPAPAGLAAPADVRSRFQEAELIHSRWAMAGVAGILAVELLGQGNWISAQTWVRTPCSCPAQHLVFADCASSGVGGPGQLPTRGVHSLQLCCAAASLWGLCWHWIVASVIGPTRDSDMQWKNRGACQCNAPCTCRAVASTDSTCRALPCCIPA